MTHLKKSLAMLLAVVMMFSSMSVAASAWNPNVDEDNDVRFTVLFFREDKNGNWVQTDKAAPGEEVEARVYVETTFATAQSMQALVFDSDFFSASSKMGTVSGNYVKDDTPKFNTAYQGYDASDAANVVPVSITHTGAVSWIVDETKHGYNYNNALIKQLVKEGYKDTEYGLQSNGYLIDENYFGSTNLLTSNIYFSSGIKTAGYTVDRDSSGNITEDGIANDWLLAYELKVNDNERTNTVESVVDQSIAAANASDATEEDIAARLKKGYAKVPEMYNTYERATNNISVDNNLFIDVYRSRDNIYGADASTTLSMKNWIDEEPDVTSVAGILSTTSYITFDLNGGNINGSTDDVTQEGIIGTSATIDDPVRDGYTFGGWEYSSGDKNVLEYDVNGMIFDYDKKELKATWTPNQTETIEYTYNVYEMNAKGVYELKSSKNYENVEVDQKVYNNAVAPSEGFYVDEETEKTPEFTPEYIIISDDNSSNVLNVYYARYDYTVNYVYSDDGGEHVQTDSPVYHGDAFPEFKESVNGWVPQGTGKDFAGWSLSRDGEVLDELPETVTGDVTLYAIYKPAKVTYNFFAYSFEDAEKNGSFSTTTDKIISLEFDYGTKVDEETIKAYVPDPTRDGCEFIGWTSYDAIATEDTDIYADYTVLDYTVEFWDGDSKIDGSELILNYGDTVNAEDVPEGYKTQNAWTLADGTTVVNFPYTVTESVKLYATDSANVYDARFYVDGQLYATVPTIYLEQVVAPEYTVADGYTFSGWDAAFETDGDVMDDVNGKDYYATTTPKDITLTFVDGDKETELTGKFGTKIENIPAISEKEGYEAGVWSPSVPETYPSTDTTYTATWAPKTNVLTFVDVENGAEKELGRISGATDSTIEAQPDPTKTGYTFTGWKDEDGAVIKTAPTVMPTESKKYTAQWQINNYDFSFDANGGEFAEGAESSGNKPYGTKITVPVPTKEGYTFLGWADASVENPTEKDVILSKDTEKVTLEGELSLKAVWSQDVYTVTFKTGAENDDSALIVDDKGIKHSELTINVKYGEAIPEISATRNGYTFAGWKDAESNGVPEYMPAENLSFTAQWTKIPDPVTEVEYKVYAVTQIPGSDEYSEPTLVKTGSALPGTTIEIVDGEPANENQIKFSSLVEQVSQVPDTDKTTDRTLEVTKDGENSLTVYFKLKTFTATFNAGEDAAWTGGDTTKTDSGEFGYAIEIPATNPNKTGYDFKGWAGYTKGDTYAEDKTYEAVWELQTHDAIFNVVDENGDTVITETVPVKYGQPITVPAITLPKGYEYVNGTGFDVDGDTMGEADVTYTATITPIDYTLTYVITNSDVAAAPGAETFNIGDEITVKSATEVAGYEFVGWTTNDGATYPAGYKFTVKEAADITLTGTYKGIAYDINFNTNDDSYVPSIEAVCGSSVTELPAVPDDPDDDKLALGWYKEDGTKVTLPFTMPAGDMTLEAKWAYKVSYEYTGTVPAGAAEQLPGSSFKAPAESVVIAEAPAVEGYTFSGWLINGVPAANFTMGDEPVVITGSWTSNDADDRTVTYKYTSEAPEGAPAVNAPQTVKVGETVTPVVPEFEGYKFVGWLNSEGEVVKSFTMPDGDVVLTGYWVKNVFKVEYAYTGEIPAGALALLPESATVTVGETVEIEDAPELEGYEFSGWFNGEAEATDFTMPAEDVTITGYWTKNVYNVSYEYTGYVPSGVPAAPEAADVKVGDSVAIAADPTFDGWTFHGWYNGDADAADFNMPAEDVTLTGYWTKNEPTSYTVYYQYTGEVPEGAPAVPGSALVAVNAPVTIAAEPTLSGWVFNGWYIGTDAAEDFNMPEHDVTITGYWTEAPEVIEKYTLSLDPNGGTLDGSTAVFTEEYEEGTNIPPVVLPVREGYRFVRWTDADGNTQIVPATMPGNDVSLKAEWTKLYTVKYVNEDDTVYEEIVNAGAAGENIPAPTKGDPSKDGYYFVKWVDATTGETVTTFPAADVTLEPVFEKIVPNTYTITYKYNGTVPNGAPALPETTSSEANKTITVAAVPELKGYTFVGWKYKGVTAESFVMPAENVTIEGEWVAKTYTIILDANSGEFADGTMQFAKTDVAYGTELKNVIPESPKKEGYTFGGWVDSEGNDVVIPATMPDYSINAKADWDINSYEIKFNSNGGTDVDPVKFEYGAEIKDLPTPTKEGFIFKGWVDADGNDLPANMPANNLEAYAEWEAEPTTETSDLVIDANGGAFSDGKEEHEFELAVGDSLESYLKNEPTRDGYEFTGWDGVPEDGKMPAGGLTITATWKEVVKTHKVTYYLAEGGAAYEEKTFEEGAAIVNPEDPKLEGFTFKGWVDADGKEIPTVMGTEDIEAYAKFEINTYKVTYMVEGEVYHSEDVVYQAEIPVPKDPVSSDPTMIFAGWEPTVASTMPAKDVTYTAKFVKAPVEGEKFIAKFTVDGKTHDIQVLEEGDAIKLPADPQKFGYKFVGWLPEVPSAMPAEDIEFVAQWEIDETFITIVVGGTVIAGGIIAGSIIGANAAWITGVSIVGGILVIVGVAELVKHTHTVTYIVDGEIYKTYKVVEGTKIPVPADPAKDGFKFEGWNPEVPEKMGETDLVFEATWSEGAVDGSDDSDVDVDIPDTGSVAGGLTAFAIISGAAAAAYVITRKKKED